MASALGFSMLLAPSVSPKALLLLVSSQLSLSLLLLLLLSLSEAALDRRGCRQNQHSQAKI
jgi:hypothetical protein